MNLWIDGQMISVKHSMVCLDKNSQLAKNFSDDTWVRKHTVTTDDGTKMVLIGYSSVILSVINQLRLRSMMVDSHELPNIKDVKVESVENIVSDLFPGNEKFILGKNNGFDSEIIKSECDYSNYLISWLRDVNRRNESELLYRASRNGWEPRTFHYYCDNHNHHTLVIFKDNNGYIFGGYSDQKWGGDDGCKSSRYSFLFSLKCRQAGLPPSKMKLKPGMEEEAVRVSPRLGPCFGDKDIRVGYCGHELRKVCTRFGQTYELPSGGKEYFLTGEVKPQLLDEIEVFKI